MHVCVLNSCNGRSNVVIADGCCLEAIKYLSCSSNDEILRENPKTKSRSRTDEVITERDRFDRSVVMLYRSSRNHYINLLISPRNITHIIWWSLSVSLLYILSRHDMYTLIIFRWWLELSQFSSQSGETLHWSSPWIIK